MPWSEVIRSPRCVFQDFTIACTRHHAAIPRIVKADAAQLSKMLKNLLSKQTIAACRFFLVLSLEDVWIRLPLAIPDPWVLKSGGLSVSGNAVANTPVNNRWQTSDLRKTCKAHSCRQIRPVQGLLWQQAPKVRISCNSAVCQLYIYNYH